MRSALALHYDRRFVEASAAYQAILDVAPSAEERAMAMQQIDNLRRLVPAPPSSTPAQHLDR